MDDSYKSLFFSTIVPCFQSLQIVVEILIIYI